MGPALSRFKPLLTLAAVGVIAACSGESGLICNPDSIYLEADVIDPLRIPDDLSVPDETESLRIPEGLGAISADEAAPDHCLDASPAFRSDE
jgi:uncharacterized lipoprotein